MLRSQSWKFWKGLSWELKILESRSRKFYLRLRKPVDYHSIYVFRFDLLDSRKCTLTNVCVSEHGVHF